MVVVVEVVVVKHDLYFAETNKLRFRFRAYLDATDTYICGLVPLSEPEADVLRTDSSSLFMACNEYNFPLISRPPITWRRFFLLRVIFQTVARAIFGPAVPRHTLCGGTGVK